MIGFLLITFNRSPKYWFWNDYLLIFRLGQVCKDPAGWWPADTKYRHSNSEHGCSPDTRSEPEGVLHPHHHRRGGTGPGDGGDHPSSAGHQWYLCGAGRRPQADQPKGTKNLESENISLPNNPSLKPMYNFGQYSQLCVSRIHWDWRIAST